MDLMAIEERVKNIDERTQRIEQILPTLPTRTEMREAIQKAIEPLATKKDFEGLATKKDLEGLATKNELQKAIEPLATKKELAELAGHMEERFATKAELREEGVQTRRHFDVVAESLRDDIRLIAEGQVGLAERMEAMRIDLKADIAGLDRRVMRLEASSR